MGNIPNTNTPNLVLQSVGNGSNDSRWGTSSGGGGFTMPSGTIVDYAGSSAPTDWLLCNGASVSTTTYATLFAAIGYTYGGSGASFTLPNAVDRVTIGAGSTYTLGQTGGNATTTLSVANLALHSHDLYLSHSHDTDATHGHGFTQGTHHHAISGLSHTHSVTNTSHAHSADTTDPGAYGAFWGNGVGNNFKVGTSATGGIDAGRMSATGSSSLPSATAAASLTGTYNTGSNIIDTASSVNTGSGTITSSTSLLGPLATDTTGSATPFSNLPPYLALNKIIKT